MQVYWVLALVFAIFVAAFAVQNAGDVSVRFLTWQWETSIALVVLGAAAVGAVVAGLLGTVRQLSLSFKVRNLQGKIARLEKQLEESEPERQEIEPSDPESVSETASSVPTGQA